MAPGMTPALKKTGEMEIIEQEAGLTLFVDGEQWYVQGPVGKAIQFVDESAASFCYNRALAMQAGLPRTYGGSLHPGSEEFTQPRDVEDVA